MTYTQNIENMGVADAPASHSGTEAMGYERGQIPFKLSKIVYYLIDNVFVIRLSDIEALSQ